MRLPSDDEIWVRISFSLKTQNYLDIQLIQLVIKNNLFWTSSEIRPTQNAKWCNLKLLRDYAPTLNVKLKFYKLIVSNVQINFWSNPPIESKLNKSND